MNHIDAFNTHIEVYPYKKDDIPVIEDMYTATDKFTNKQFACGYLIDNEKLYLPRGTSISKLEMLLECKANFIDKNDDCEIMTTEHASIYEPRNKIQEESIKFLQDDTKQCALNLKTGIGKCEPNSRKIPSPDFGYKLMGDIKPGDRVFGSDGSIINVLKIFPQGEQDIYQITFADGRIAECGGDHLWTILYPNAPDKKMTLTTLELLETKYKQYAVQTISDAVEYPYYETDNIAKIYALDMSDSKSDTTSIDHQYLINDVITRRNLLRGFINGNYYIKTSRFNSSIRIIKSRCSTKLYQQLKWLLNSLQYTHTKRDIYYQNITYIKIKDIRKVRREECTCITVDSRDHLYLTEDFIVTHNTFCVAYASTAIGDRTLVITPNESLKQQWIKTYNTMFDYRGKQLMNIAGSNIIEGIMNDNIDINNTDVFFVNHQTLRSYITSTNGYQFHNFMKKLRVGIKVYDESHMEFGNILLIDFFSNTKRTWYLTATFDRSDKTESVCFKRAFQSVEAYGDLESAEVVRKHVIFHKVSFSSRINPQQRAKLLGFPGFNANKYGIYSIFEDKNETLYKVILEILKKTKDVEGKTLIFVPLIDCVDEIVKKLKVDFPEKTCAAFHSKIPRDEKEVAEKKDIIVSTIKSCGTGRDIKGLRVVICAEPVVSKVVIEQTIGRLRPYAPDKDTYYFDLVDYSIPQINYWYRARYRKIETLVKSTIMLDM